MTYTLKITAKKGYSLGWAMRNGEKDPYENQRDIVFVVKSSEKDRISSDDFLVQTGMEWDKSYSKPMWITTNLDWTVEVVE